MADHYALTPRVGKYSEILCPECGGKGFFDVDDNGTNNGEEECDYCNAEGAVWVDEFGDRRGD